MRCFSLARGGADQQRLGSSRFWSTSSVPIDWHCGGLLKLLVRGLGYARFSRRGLVRQGRIGGALVNGLHATRGELFLQGNDSFALLHAGDLSSLLNKSTDYPGILV